MFMRELQKWDSDRKPFLLICMENLKSVFVAISCGNFVGRIAAP